MQKRRAGEIISEPRCASQFLNYVDALWSPVCVPGPSLCFVCLFMPWSEPRLFDIVSLTFAGRSLWRSCCSTSGRVMKPFTVHTLSELFAFNTDSLSDRSMVRFLSKEMTALCLIVACSLDSFCSSASL